MLGGGKNDIVQLSTTSKSPYRRVRHGDGDCEELSRHEVEKCKASQANTDNGRSGSASSVRSGENHVKEQKR